MGRVDRICWFYFPDSPVLLMFDATPNLIRLPIPVFHLRDRRARAVAVRAALGARSVQEKVGVDRPARGGERWRWVVARIRLMRPI
jgi:hypothetical protein